MQVGPRPIRGVVGRIDWGYFAAGAINGYRLSRCGDGTWSLRGTLVSFDAFKIRQRNLIFAAPWRTPDTSDEKGKWIKDEWRGKWAEGEWRWPVTTIDLGEGHGPRELRATLGPQLPEMITG